LPNVKIVNYGEVIYQGSIDVNAEVDRIRRGEARNHRNDGGVFNNRERLLPAAERGAYREFVYVQRGIPFPGPARLVISRTGDVWFTGDHYSSFIRVPRANRSSIGGQQ
jgi:guanyl-specific ribonuclease Sa